MSDGRTALTSSGPAAPAAGRRLRVDARFLPLGVTLGLFVLMFGAGSLLFDGFFSLQVFLNLFIDNAFLLVTATGMTFVILSAGIDLSVGSVIALSTMISASLLEHHGWNPIAVIILVLAVGASLGFVHGFLIQYFDIQPFIVTLAGMFLARGLCYLISINSIAITNPLFVEVSLLRLPLPFDTSITVNVLIALVVFVLGIYLAHYTRFGRTVYAIGGSEQSALLMGLPVARTKILIYTLSGFCSALAGVVFTFYMLSGYGLHAGGFEMDAIATVVIGGTLLNGGAGYMAGTLVGVLIYGTIQTLIMFQGTLSAWWTKIVIGLLLLVFCLLQQVFERGSRRGSRWAPPGGGKGQKPAAAPVAPPERRAGVGG
jgi:simple sugar transport system permease protein